MRERKRLLLLILIMITVSMIAVVITNALLYDAAFNEERARLVETAQSQARLIEAIARFNAALADLRHIQKGALDATLSQVVEAHMRYKGSTRTGEFTLARLEGDQIVFLLRHRRLDLLNPEPLSIHSELAEPMRRALSGMSGTVIGPDYQGNTVLAAYEPVAVLNLGIVVKIDLAEIRAPFVRAGATAGGLAFLVVFIGALLFIKVTNPVIHRLRERTSQLAAANEQLQNEIKERSLSEKALRKSEEGYREVVEGTSDLIARLDREGRFIYVNHVSERVFGVSPERCVGMSALDFFYPEDRDRNQSALEGWVRSKARHVTHENRQVNQITGETHDMLWTINLHYDERGSLSGINCIGRDLTGQKRAEKEKEKMERRLQVAQKMEAIAALAGGIAHQFNNALAAIMGNIELLGMDSTQPEVVKKYVEPMKISSQRMAHLTDQLLAYARGGKYQPTVFSLRDFVEEAMPMIEHDLPPGIHVETDLPGDLWYVEGDMTQMQMALAAPLANASESIEGRGRIHIRCRNVEVTEDLAGDSPGLKPGAYVCLTVEDDGKGMDEQTNKRVFEPFFSTKFAGRGLSMAAVYGIIKNHGGWISVESEPGRGTIVSIYLPAIEMTEERREAPGIVKAEKPRTILYWLKTMRNGHVSRPRHPEKAGTGSPRSKDVPGGG